MWMNDRAYWPITKRWFLNKNRYTGCFKTLTRFDFISDHLQIYILPFGLCDMEFMCRDPSTHPINKWYTLFGILRNCLFNKWNYLLMESWASFKILRRRKYFFTSYQFFSELVLFQRCQCWLYFNILSFYLILYPFFKVVGITAHVILSLSPVITIHECLNLIPAS